MNAYLTPAQIRVFRTVIRGFSNREAASHLHVEPKTVAKQMGEVQRVYGVKSRSKLFALFVDHHKVEESIAAHAKPKGKA